MEGAGDSDFFEKESGIKQYSLGSMNVTEGKPVRNLKTRFKRNLLTNAQKSFHFLEHQSLVNCLEADNEFIISAGRDHDINIWGTIEGRHIRRLSGHTAPVTGLALYASAEPPYEKRIVSCSEDETIIQWCLNKGEQVFKIETKNLVTCMGIMNRRLAVVGNHRGYMEVYHLSSGDLYSTILAHLDPIDAITVEGNYVCSAVFEAPPSLKVWRIQYEQLNCVYCIENSQMVEISCLAMWNTKLILGSSEQQKLLVVDFKTDGKGVIDLERPNGRLKQVRVWNEWILSCSADTGNVLLDVHRIHNYEHFGTFDANMPQVSAIAAVEFDNSFKVILGGSALAVLSFDFVLTDEAIRLPFNRSMNTCSKPSFGWNKTGSHYALENSVVQIESPGLDKDTSDDEETHHDSPPSNTSTPQSNFHRLHYRSLITDSVEKIRSPQTIFHTLHDGSFKTDNEEKICLPQSNVHTLHDGSFKSANVGKICPPQSNFHALHDGSFKTDNVEKSCQQNQRPSQMLSVLTVSPTRYEGLPFDYEKMRLERMLQICTEPRAAMRKLEESLDKHERPKEVEKCSVIEETERTAEHDAPMDEPPECALEGESINEEQAEVTLEQMSEKAEKDNYDAECDVTEMLSLLKTNHKEMSEEKNEVEEFLEKTEKNSKNIKKFCLTRKLKGKKDRTKQLEKSKHKKCQIM